MKQKYMTFLNDLKNILGENVWQEIEKIAGEEVSRAKAMPLLNMDRKPNYHHQNFLLPKSLSLYQIFEDKNLKMTPQDLSNILFKCKMLFACSTEAEYDQRSPGGSIYEEGNFTILWEKSSVGYDKLLEEYLERAQDFLIERTLKTELSMFRNCDVNGGSARPLVKAFLDDVFKDLGLTFGTQIDNDILYVCFSTTGTWTRCFWYSSHFLRSFLSMLKIAAFKHPTQLDYGDTGIEVLPVIGPIFEGESRMGGYDWNENEREPFMRYPDGCLFRSFGNRSLNKAWLDHRNFISIKKFILDNAVIFDFLKNTWDEQAVHDIAPTLDLLSAATQIQDLGAKILLLYCSLEHLFVPKDKNKNNREYIIGGINALKPSIMPWFNELYKLRCDYAHKGFILDKSNITLGVIMSSLVNIVELLSLKLKTHS